MEKDKIQNDTYNIKNKNSLHINDVIFKDSIQSAITPNLEITSLSEHSIDNDIISSDTLRPPIEEVSADLNEAGVTNVVKTPSSPALDLSSNDSVFTENSSKSIDDIPGIETDDEEPYTTSTKKEIDQNHIQLLKDLEEIPDRMAFKISEVSDLTRIKSYVLRYWESEFEQLKPKKAINNRRMYTQKDVTTILLIKKLLYEDKYSIEGAKKALKQLQVEVKKEHKTFIRSSQQQKAIDQLKDLICNISSLKDSLSSPIED